MKKIYFSIIFTALTALYSFGQVNTLTESFNAASPVGWTATNNSSPVGTGGWNSGSAPSGLAGYQGAGCAVVNYTAVNSAGDISAWYLSPQVNLKDGATITFFTRTATGAQYPDRLEVRLSTAGASANVGSTTTSVGDFTNLICTINPSLQSGVGTGCGSKYPDTWTQISLTVSGVGTSPVAGRIAFRYNVTNGGLNGSNSNIIGIDEFSYDNTTCSTPVAGTASAPASACNNTNFTLTLAGFSPAGAVIQWESSPVGTNTWTTVAGATSSASTVSQTGPRDYRAKVNCPGGGGTTVYSNTVTVTQNSSTCPPTCTTNVSPANNATNVSYQPNLVLTWTAASGATSYDVYIGTSTPGLVTNVTGTTVNLTGASPNTTYTWYVVSKNANGGLNNCSSNATSFTTGAAAPAPANDECSGAITLTGYMGAAGYSGTTVSATASAGITSCGSTTTWGTPDDDVWFKFVPVQNGNATITVVGAGSFDAVIQLFSGTCGSLVQVGTCTDGTADGGTETMSATGLTAGQTYYLRVYDWTSTSTGNFTIKLSGTALPVSISEFSGRSEGSSNVLNWKTATEINNIGFSIERSVDGSKFSSIGFVSSKAEGGNSTSALSYTYTDLKPSNGNNYYRLKQTDKDGKSSYSSIVVLKSRTTEFSISSIYPNPAKTSLNLVVNAPSAERFSIVITDLSGKIVLQKTTQAAVGENQLELNIQALSSGSYFLKVVCASGCESAVQRFVKN